MQRSTGLSRDAIKLFRKDFFTAPNIGSSRVAARLRSLCNLCSLQTVFGVWTVAMATTAAIAAKVLATTEDQLHDPVPVPPVIMPFLCFSHCLVRSSRLLYAFLTVWVGHHAFSMLFSLSRSVVMPFLCFSQSLGRSSCLLFAFLKVWAGHRRCANHIFCWMIMRHEAPNGPYFVSFWCLLLYTKGHFTLSELEGPWPRCTHYVIGWKSEMVQVHLTPNLKGLRSWRNLNGWKNYTVS